MLGEVFYLTLATRDRQPLLDRDDACALLASTVERGCRRNDARLLAFCFMPDRLHLLVEAASRTTDPAKLLSSIASHFERRWYDRHGAGNGTRVDPTVWERATSRIVEVRGPNAVLDAIHAVHRNPVARGLCSSPGDWRWSSYRGALGLGETDAELPHITPPAWERAAR